MPTGKIESLDHKARGVTYKSGIPIFIDGALPGELVEYTSYRKTKEFELAQLLRLIEPSSQRTKPHCPHFGICGGCSMQHLDAAAQVAAKQKILEEQLSDCNVHAESFLSPIHGPYWAYRQRARLSVRWVEKKNSILVGFHEKRSSFIADMTSCAVLNTRVSKLLLPLRALIGKLSICKQIPQIEVATDTHCVALVLRILEAPSANDQLDLVNFAKEHQIIFYLQPKGIDSIYPLQQEASVHDQNTHATNFPLRYTLPEFGIEYQFFPTDFTQINHNTNQVLVRRAMQLLDPKPGELIADMFCGLGNFSLPIARAGAQVIGIENNAALLERGNKNAAHHNLSTQVRFEEANLFSCTSEFLNTLGKVDKILIDPPRDGAIELIQALEKSKLRPRRIVYVSCNPITLARDAATLVHEQGWHCKNAGIINMFPHTNHIESIALFEHGMIP